MDYVKLGTSGLEVSPLAVGCMSFGPSDRGNHAWTLDEDRSREIIREALEAGLNFFDTANVYSDGGSEEIVGRALRDMAVREEVVIATKVHGAMGPGPNRRGLSRKAIIQEVDASLRRLGVDTIDLLIIHRSDPTVPLHETLTALDDVVRAGKVLHLGASSMPAWRFVKAREHQRQHGLAPFISMQNQYSLIYREEERDLLPYCAHEGIGTTPWSPLGRGKLARPWGVRSDRADTDQILLTQYQQAVDSDRAVVEVVQEIAEARGVPMAQVALAWVRSRPTVASPIIGATSPQHLRDALAALDLVLDDDETARLEAPYVARMPEMI